MYGWARACPHPVLEAEYGINKRTAVALVSRAETHGSVYFNQFWGSEITGTNYWRFKEELTNIF